MELAIAINDPARLAALSRALAAYNERNTPLSEQDFLLRLVEGQLDSLVGSYVKTTLSKLDFLDRFTVDERVAIREAALSNGVVKDYLELLAAASEVSLVSQRTIGGVQALEDAQLIAAGRAVEILAL